MEELAVTVGRRESGQGATFPGGAGSKKNR